jgi:protocatechuate 3,4-dioxygenase beta subunit
MNSYVLDNVGEFVTEVEVDVWDAQAKGFAVVFKSFVGEDVRVAERADDDLNRVHELSTNARLTLTFKGSPHPGWFE